ncbi:MAG: type II toxin-antitoxin system RelE/ParE family toxin [Pseudomonadota bacterium]|nr:type II toxin-antitoxin system RelE/ParE family toxin [Pseudomonadota bacterium]MDP1903333.1 type II toxin-antitoxin system RelE/ParE family toxin [Pseudomonadota bacterium]MDP2354223.1 type II toxin-antitoxin system RelE/ParE family toxin [Pseudomonadota bacterium]
MTLPLRETGAAAWELDEALAYYSDIHPDVAGGFFQEVGRAKQLISQFPLAWKNLDRGLKEFVIRHHPYTLVYQVREDMIWILAYAHHSRRPGYWKDRLRNTH